MSLGRRAMVCGAAGVIALAAAAACFSDRSPTGPATGFGYIRTGARPCAGIFGRRRR